jgi:excisionase family DNA binding protein
MEQKKLMKPKEVADLLNISIKTVYEWTKSDKLPYITLFNEIRFHQEVIQNIYNNGLPKPEALNNISKPKSKRKQIQKRVLFWELKQEKLQA